MATQVADDGTAEGGIFSLGKDITQQRLAVADGFLTVADVPTLLSG
jgi:hypothetical protein